MTVCIAALGGSQRIVCASDRMKTARGGLVQYEPTSPKIQPLTKSIVSMSAGDANANKEILNRIIAEIDLENAENRKKLTVYDAARHYSKYYFELRNEKAERAILIPIGLDFDILYERQQTFQKDFLEGLSYKLGNFPLILEAIIAGVDATGGHLYTVKNGQIDCWDGIGFCSIGIGQSHADFQFMVIGHTPDADPLKTLWITFLAKKSAEVSAGVGDETDIYLMGPEKGDGLFIPKAVMGVLKKMYDEQIDATGKLAEKYISRLDNALESLSKKQIKKEQG